MRRRRFVGVAVVVFAAVVIGLYYTYVPHAPRDDWPVLQPASTASNKAQVIVGPNVHVSASLDQFNWLQPPLRACADSAHYPI